MTNTIEKRAVKNSLIGALSFSLSLVQTVITVPVLLSCWGNEKYGLWLALFAGFSMLQTVDAGHQNYVGNKFNVLYHKDKGELKEVLGSSLLIAFFLGLVEVGFCVLLIFSGYLPAFLGITPEMSTYYHTPLSLLTLILMWLIFGSAGGLLVRLLIPVGMMGESIWWGIIVRASQFLSLMAVAASGGSVLMACMVFAAVQSVVSAAIFVYIKAKVPEFYPWWEKRRWSTALYNFKKSLVLTLTGITQQLSNNGLVLFVSALFQTTAVPGFTTIRTLTNTAASVANILSASLLPDIVRFHTKGEVGKLLSTFRANWFFSGILVNVGILVVLPFIADLYAFWTKGKLPFNPALFLSLAASISFINFGSALNMYLSGINDLHSQTSMTFLRAIVLFIAALILTDYWGLVGIGIAVLLSEVVCSSLLPMYFVNRKLEQLGGALDLKSSVIALAPSLILTLVAVLSCAVPSFIALSGVGLFLLLVIYFFAWKDLDMEVKNRFKQLRVGLMPSF